jgi:hypothetical protein
MCASKTAPHSCHSPTSKQPASSHSASTTRRLMHPPASSRLSLLPSLENTHALSHARLCSQHPRMGILCAPPPRRLAHAEERLLSATGRKPRPCLSSSRHILYGLLSIRCAPFSCRLASPSSTRCRVSARPSHICRGCAQSQRPSAAEDVKSRRLRCLSVPIPLG